MQDQSNLQQRVITAKQDNIGENAVVLRKFATSGMSKLLKAIQAVEWAGGRRHIQMLGMLAEIRLPEALATLASEAAAAAVAGFDGYEPDYCQLRQYLPWMGRFLAVSDEQPTAEGPIVSISLGMPAMFQLGLRDDSSPAVTVPLRHGDVVVWSSPSQLFYHGPTSYGDDDHPELGCLRLNVTFRRKRSDDRATILN